jgi:hypothetical protein
VAYKLRKRRYTQKQLKTVGVATLIAVVIIAFFAVVWFIEPNVSYWFVAADSYSPTGNNSFTVYCQSDGGALAATFDLVLQFTRADFDSSEASQPYQQLDSQTIKYTYTLARGQQQNTIVYFVIDKNVTDFYISLSFQQHGSDFLLKSSPGGVDSVSYQKDSTGNFEMRRFIPPP